MGRIEPNGPDPCLPAEAAPAHGPRAIAGLPDTLEGMASGFPIWLAESPLPEPAHPRRGAIRRFFAAEEPL
jgi:hypothetical protein